MNWKKEKFYAFPLFACLSKTLQKIYYDKAKGILIAPEMPSQPLNTRLIEMSFHVISILPRKRNLYIPYQPSLLHPPQRKLLPLAFLVYGATIH